MGQHEIVHTLYPSNCIRLDWTLIKIKTEQAEYLYSNEILYVKSEMAHQVLVL